VFHFNSTKSTKRVIFLNLVLNKESPYLNLGSPEDDYNSIIIRKYEENADKEKK
jgi:hypothetical protein